jgi:tetratricopeptide (TPR) repeat protein
MSAPDSCLTLNRQKLLDEVNRRQIKREMLAEDIGVTPRTLRRWLHGQTTRVQMMHLDQLARRLGCAITDLIADEPATDLPFQSPDVHPLLQQLRRYVLQDATQENFECATRVIHGSGAALPFDIQAAALYEYARFAFQLGHISQAQRSFERAVLKADAAGVDAIRFQSFLSLAQLSSVQHDDGGEREGMFLEQAEHVLARMRAPHWRPYLWLMEARHALTQGQLDKAQALGDNALLVLQDEPGEPTLDRIESYDILSMIFHAVGSRRKALDLSMTLSALQTPAGPIQAMGQYETAEKMYREAARLLQQADPFHVRILDQVRNQADCLLHMNRAEEAAQILKVTRSAMKIPPIRAVIVFCRPGHWPVFRRKSRRL